MIDKREFETVFRRHYDGMFRLAMRMLGNDAESKDVVSDVFAHLLHSGTDLRSETLQAFLLTSVRNRCINLLVHRQREQQMQKAVVVEMITPEQTAEQEQLQQLSIQLHQRLEAMDSTWCDRISRYESHLRDSLSRQKDLQQSVAADSPSWWQRLWLWLRGILVGVAICSAIYLYLKFNKKI
jgi:RNA polymerase sigma factor (sigma-70 family)